jgi:hypothetical protein
MVETRVNGMRMSRTLAWALAAALLATLAAACALKTSGRLAGDAATDVPVEMVGDNLCPAGMTPCGEVCIDTDTSRNNCGACGNACGPLEQCEEGACVCPLDEGALECGGVCVDPLTDVFNCGTCGNACAEGEVCNAEGECDLRCSGDLVRCGSPPDEYCADLLSDPDNCSGCGLACEAPAHAFAVCDGGSCTFQCEAGWVDVVTTDDDGCECHVTSVNESCDGSDENCDGTVDEGFDCVPGEVESCPPCGLRTCDDSCSWGPCTGSAECDPSEVQEETCCGTGTRTRTCQPDCTWGPWSPCTTSGVCRPGTTRCCTGWQVQTCGDTCQWGTCYWCPEDPDEQCCDSATQACVLHNHPCPP